MERRWSAQRFQASPYHVSSGAVTVAEIVQIDQRPFTQMVIRQQHIGQEKPEILRWDRREAIGQGLEEADKVVGKGPVEAEKTIRTAEGGQKMSEDLGNVIELQPFIFGNWSTLARHRPLDGLGRLIDIRTSREIRWVQARQDRPPAGC